MSHAEICPVCKGSGKLYKKPDPAITGNCSEEIICHGCGGSGWITIMDSDRHRYSDNWDGYQVMKSDYGPLFKNDPTEKF